VTARVRRDGSWRPAPARELVTGDVVRLRTGDFVPADVALCDGALRIDQSALTGESREIEKVVDDALYAGSTVRAGEATGVVVATGARTYFGRTTQLVEGAHPRLHVDLAAGGFAEVFPEDKYLVVKSLQAAGAVVGMTGDGVNDAPALRQAEVGIAVRSATDVAKGAASAVLTTDGLANIVDLVKSGRATYQRVLTWIMNKISRSILKAGFVVIAFLVTGKFVISALVMLLLVCLTDLTHVAPATDRVQPSPQPETWNIGPLVRVSALLGVMTLVEALGLLAFGWHRFGLAGDAGLRQTFTFQTFLFFALSSLLSVRERRPFFRSRPSATLAASLVAAAVDGTLIGLHGVADLAPLPFAVSALVFGYATVCSLGPNDLVKSLLCARALRVARPERASGRGRGRG
jgi:magnesium-transporting ATPase (P-type)